MTHSQNPRLVKVHANRKAFGMESRKTRLLTPSRTQLIRLMQEIGYGRIQSLQIELGEPVVDPLPKCIKVEYLKGPRSYKVKNLPNSTNLKAQVRQLFSCFDRRKSFVIDEIFIEGGLPIRVDFQPR